MQRLVLVAVLGLSLAACDEKTKKLPADVQSMEQLKAAGKGPLELVSAMRSIAPLPNGAVFNVTVKNRSDRTIKVFKSTLVAFDSDKKLVELEHPESGWGGDIEGLAAGETVKLQVMVPTEKATKLKLVFNEAIYDVPNPMGEQYGTLAMEWKNAKAEQELSAARASAD